ncbi:MAG: glycosyltransferase [Bdellovibrionales bacterium]|nr:glycosyltransferase [Bdellovibrionales bacterium]
MKAIVVSGREWVVASSPRYWLTQNLAQEIARSLLTKKAAAFCWDDLVLTPQPMRLNWPRCFVETIGENHLSGRFAVDKSVIQDLYKRGLVAQRDDWAGALRELFKTSPELVIHLPNVFRLPTPLSDWQSRHTEANLPQEILKFDPSVSVIINYRDRVELMESCLMALEHQHLPSRMEIILVNNQSTPENREKVDGLLRKLPAQIARQHLDYPYPFNHSAQSNLGARHANGDILVMVNNDAQAQSPYTLRLLAGYASLPGVATVGPRFVGDNGRLVSSGVEIYPDARLLSGAGFKESEQPYYSRQIHETAGNSFAFAAIPKTVWDRVGGLDETDFINDYNDVDFFMRTLRLGLRHIYVGNATVYHEPGTSRSPDRPSPKLILERFCKKYPDISQFVDRSYRLEALPSVPATPKPFSVYKRLRSLHFTRRIRRAVSERLARLRVKYEH